MKKKKAVKIVISFIIILFLIQHSSMAKYFEILEKFSGKATIAEPIIAVEKLQEKVVSQIDRNTEKKEYYFKIKNYYLDSNGKKKYSEVGFDFNIQIINSNDNFPVKLELYDCSSNKELLNNGKKSEKIHINKNIEFEKTYKLVASWDEKENIQGSLDDINIKINADQEK